MASVRRCIQCVKRRCYGVGSHVSGELICALCSSSFGDKDGIFHCLEHSTGNVDDDIDKENEGGTSRQSMEISKVV